MVNVFKNLRILHARVCVRPLIQNKASITSVVCIDRWYLRHLFTAMCADLEIRRRSVPRAAHVNVTNLFIASTSAVANSRLTLSGN